MTKNDAFFLLSKWRRQNRWKWSENSKSNQHNWTWR